MSGREIVALCLLFSGAAVGFGAALALLPLRSFFDQLHFVGPAATLGVALVTAAILVEEGFSATGAKSLLAGALLFLLSPIVTHMTARAGWRGPDAARRASGDAHNGPSDPRTAPGGALRTSGDELNEPDGRRPGPRSGGQSELSDARTAPGGARREPGGLPSRPNESRRGAREDTDAAGTES